MEEHVDRVFPLEPETVTFVQPSSSAALQHVQSEGLPCARGQHSGEHPGPDPVPLHGRVEVEVLDPHRVILSAESDGSGIRSVHHDDVCVRDVERVEEPLPNPHLVVPAQSFEVGSQHHRAEFGDPSGIARSARPKLPHHAGQSGTPERSPAPDEKGNEVVVARKTPRTTATTRSTTRKTKISAETIR